MNHSLPRVIAFEGVDGAGKSTVLSIVAQHLRERGVPVHLPRMGKDHVSKPIREIRLLTRDRTNLELSPRAELLLYAAREAQVLEQHVRPALAAGQTVLLDRSMLTPLVLGSFGRGLELASCERIVDEAAGGMRPDLTLVFDVEPRTSRIRKRLEKVRTRAFRTTGRKGLGGSGMAERVRDGYLHVAARDNLPVIRAERGTPQDIAARVIALIETGRYEESPEQREPWWRFEPGRSFEDVVATLPPLVALYFTRSLAIGRALRAELIERETNLAIWACDLDDPLLQGAGLELAPERVLERLQRTPAAMPLRERLLERFPVEVARSLEQLADEQSDRMREQLAERAPGAVVESLAGRNDPFAVALRSRLWKEADVFERATSLELCDDDEAWRRREKLLEKDPAIALAHMRGLDPKRVDPLLERYAERAPKSVVSALHGRSDEVAHRLRQRLLPCGREVVDSIAGLDDAGSWALREQTYERWASTVVTSLFGIHESERARSLIDRCREVGRGDLFLERRLELLARPYDPSLGHDDD